MQKAAEQCFTVLKLTGSDAHVLCMFPFDPALAETRGEQRVAMAELSFLRILKFMLGPPGVRFPVAPAVTLKQLLTAQVPIILVLMFDAILAMIVLTVVLLPKPQLMHTKSSPVPACCAAALPAQRILPKRVLSKSKLVRTARNKLPGCELMHIS